MTRLSKNEKETNTKFNEGTNVYGYIRVSSRDQNEDRQMIALRELSVPEKNVFMDKQSGKDFERPSYRRWIVRRGDKLDTLVADYPDTYKLTGQDEISKTYSFPKLYVSYHKPRAVSTEQRERARQIMIKRRRVKFL